MKRHLSILGSYTPGALMAAFQHNALPFAHYATLVSDNLWSRTSNGKASAILFTILFTLCFGFALTKPTTAQQYQVSYLDSLGGTNSRGDSINNRGWIAGFSRLSGIRTGTLLCGATAHYLTSAHSPDRTETAAWFGP